MPYQDALFFLIAEGRRPTGAEVLVFFSAFSSAVSVLARHRRSTPFPFPSGHEFRFNVRFDADIDFAN